MATVAHRHIEKKTPRNHLSIVRRESRRGHDLERAHPLGDWFRNLEVKREPPRRVREAVHRVHVGVVIGQRLHHPQPPPFLGRPRLIGRVDCHLVTPVRVGVVDRVKGEPSRPHVGRAPEAAVGVVDEGFWAHGEAGG